MSRDLTPKELDCLQKTYNIPSLIDNLTVKVSADEEAKPVYSDEQKEIAHRYPKLSMFGFDMLEMCRRNGVYNSDKGRALLEKIEGYFNGQELDDKELQSNVQAWYEGTFCPGYYMNDNNCEFANYLKQLISARVLVTDD